MLWSASVASRTSTSIPSAALGLAISTIIIGLSYVEDIKSTCPSSLLTVYLLLSILFDATQARTLWLTHRVAIAAVQSAIFGTKLTMLLLETREKTSYLKSPYKEYPPEATSGIVNQSFVWWLNRLFLTGYQKIIESEDLFALEPGLGSGDAGKKLKVAWEKHGLISSPALHISYADTPQAKRRTNFPCLGPFSAVSGGNSLLWPFLECV